MADDEGFRMDPRYDAAFQRGYSGPVRTVARSEPALRRSGISSPAPVHAPPPAAPELGPAAAPQAPPVVPPQPVTAPVEQQTSRDVSRNPFYLAVAALAVLLIVGGAVWLDQGFSAISENRTTTSAAYYAVVVMSFGAPLAIGIGVAIMAGLLFVLARTWRPPEEGEAR